MGNLNPSPSEILAALKKHGVDVKTVAGWDSRGRAWKGPDGSEGLLGMVVHHTANPHASEGVGPGTGILEWCTYPFGKDDHAACQMLVGKGPGDTYLIEAGSGYHCGNGGPFPAIGVNEGGFHGQFRLFGIEVDDAGTKAGSLSQYQIDQVTKIGAALAELCGWDKDLHTVITHKCWTDGCHGVNPHGPSPTKGRKNDTIDGQWGEYPASDEPKEYNAPYWRKKIADGGHGANAWDGSIPGMVHVNTALDAGRHNKATWRVACRLHDLGFLKAKPHKNDPFPTDAYNDFRAKQGWKRQAKPHLSANAQKALFGKVKP